MADNTASEILTKGLTQEKARAAIAAILRYGSLISTLVMALGLVLILLRGPASLGAGNRVGSLRTVFPRVLHLDAVGVVELGILLLLVTPIFRIVVAGIAFGLEGDYKYVFISLGVLGIVCGSIALAMG
jgi:uncharacterized membrane protein